MYFREDVVVLFLTKEEKARKGRRTRGRMPLEKHCSVNKPERIRKANKRTIKSIRAKGPCPLQKRHEGGRTGTRLLYERPEAEENEMADERGAV